MASDQDTSFASGALHGYADAARTPRRYLEFHESRAGFSFGGPVSAKNQARLKEKSISSSRSQRSNELSARLRVCPLSAFIVCRGAWCFNERPGYEDRHHLPRYRHHCVGICNGPQSRRRKVRRPRFLIYARACSSDPRRGEKRDRMITRIIGIAWLCILALVSAPAGSQTAAPQPEWINALRDGGYVIVFRHGATYQDQADTDPLNPSNVAKQRQLNDDGRALAKSIG